MNKHYDKNLENMYLICVCRGKDLAQSLEIKLIKKYGKYNKNINKTGGGERIVDGYNYVYVLIE